MGFGDVTLMAMIGAFLGWQSLPGDVLSRVDCSRSDWADTRLLANRQNEIRFGPFLSLGARWRWRAGRRFG